MSVDGSLIGALEVIGKLDDIQKAYHHVSQEFLLYLMDGKRFGAK